MKRVFRILSVCMFAALAGCSAYVATPPDSPTVIVPVAPGPNYIWVNGRWRYHRPSRNYVYVDGYYAPRGRHTGWVDGRWAQSPRGYRYVKGHWR